MLTLHTCALIDGGHAMKVEIPDDDEAASVWIDVTSDPPDVIETVELLAADQYVLLSEGAEYEAVEIDYDEDEGSHCQTAELGAGVHFLLVTTRDDAPTSAVSAYVEGIEDDDEEETEGDDEGEDEEETEGDD